MPEARVPHPDRPPADADDWRGSGAAALAGFVDKWRARWPEWAVAEAFVPAAQRGTVLAWASLQQELTEAAWGGSDPRPGEAKLGWWQEELAGWSRGARRHPLGTALQRQPAPWATLAAALPSLAASRQRPGSADEAFAAVAPFAQALSMIDAALFDVPAADGDAGVVAASLLQSRFAQAGAEGAPLAVLARVGDADPRPIWAAQLRQRWPRPPAASRPRRLWAALARARLGQADPVRPLPMWKALPIVWRAARG